MYWSKDKTCYIQTPENGWEKRGNKKDEMWKNVRAHTLSRTHPEKRIERIERT